MKNQSAFQLIELLIVIAIAGILALVSLPNLQYLQERQDGDHLKKTITGLLAQAQQAALTGNYPVGLCQSLDGWRCTVSSGKMLILFVDQYGNGEIQEQGQVITREPLPSSGELHWQFYPHYRDYWQLRAEGDFMADNGKIWWQVTNQRQPQWLIRVNQLGNISE